MMAIIGYISIMLFIACAISFFLGGLLLTLYIIENDVKYLKPAKWWLSIGVAMLVLFILSSKIFLSQL